ncbi:MAG: cytochrome c biogenesis protein CcsA, partial [Polyangiaceae bacterium]
MPRPGRTLTDGVFYALTALTALVFILEIPFVFLDTPVEARMGIVQKIFYFHVPSAYAMYLGAAACFFGSIAYLVRPTDARDAFAHAGAQAAVAFGMIVLTTGPLWGA